MKSNVLSRAGMALLASLLVALTACSTTPGTEEVSTLETADGALVVDTFTTSATVTGIDPAKRKVTLVFPEGHRTTYQAGPEVVNFAQIQIGDQVKATVTEEVAIYLGSGEPPSALASTGVALAPLGAKPAGVLVDTTRVTARIEAVDAAKHRVTLALPDGTTKKVKVGKKMDLHSVRPGDNVTVQISEGIALSVEKP